MNSCNSSIDSGLPRKNSCESHVSVYYEQDQNKEPSTGPPMYTYSRDEKVYENPPVEINDEDTINIDLPPLTWHGYQNSPKLLTATNTGRTILINGHWNNTRPYIKGGPLNGTYLFSQVHFHCPSEHEINGKRYPLEMHIVHYKTSYLTREKAMQEKDGTVVLVYLFQLTGTCETVVSQITKLGCKLKEVNSRTESTEIPLDKLITPFRSNYYIYRGSLTTKKNKYLIQWIINCNLLDVTQQEVEDLSNIITSAIGLTAKQTPRLMPECDDVYHVGEADYSLPPMKTSLADDDCTVCKHYEVPNVYCSCKLEEVECKETDGNETPNLQLVCKCKSKTEISEYICRRHGDKFICSKCKSVSASSCSKCCEGREGLSLRKLLYSGQLKSKKKTQLSCDIDMEGPDDEVVLRCKNKNLLMDCYKNMKKKTKKNKNSKKSQKSSDCESEKSSSKSSVSETQSKSKLDSRTQCGEFEVEEEDHYKHIKKKKEKTKKKKKSKKSQKSSDCESEKSSSKSSVSETQSKSKLDSRTQCGEFEVQEEEHYKHTKKKKEKTKKKKNSKKRQKSSDCESEKSSSKSSVSETQSKGRHEVEEETKKDLRFKEEIVSESVEDNKVKKKKKKKKDIEVQESIFTLKNDQSKPSVRTITILPQLELSSGGLISFTPKPSSEGMHKEKKKLCSSNTSANDTDGTEEESEKLDSPKSSANEGHETEEEKKTENAEIPEVKITQSYEIIEETLSAILAKASKGSVDKEKKDGMLKNPGRSRSAKSRSKSRTDMEKIKDAESPERKKSAARRSKSKSPVTEISAKNKSSMKKESDGSDCPDSKPVVSDASKSKTAEPAKSAQEVKCAVKKSITEIENFKSDIAPAKDSKTKSIKLRKKSTEEAKGKNKADSEEQKSKQDYDITTIFEKKPDGKKAQSLAGDFNDVKVNFLLAPDTSIKSDPSGPLIASESDFVEEKKASEKTKKSHFSQDFTVNTATIAGSVFPPSEFKEQPQGCLLMEHVFRSNNKEKAGEGSSQEYHVAIMYDQCILQEYKGKFYPQELQLGDCEKLELVPRYPEPENFNFLLQDCFIKKQSVDQICVRVKFLVKDLQVSPVSANTENGTSENKQKLLFDQQTQCSLKELGLVKSCISRSGKQSKNINKILESRSSEILINEYKLENEENEKQQLQSEKEAKARSKSEEEQKPQSKNEEKQNQQLKSQEKQEQQSKYKSIHWENEKAVTRKSTNKLQSDPDAYSQDAYRSSVTEQFSTDLSLKDNKTDTERNERNEKKIKSLFVKRRKTVYFIYDKVEKDEHTGKKIFVGSFKTKEEVDNMKKQNPLFPENEIISASEKSEETSEAKVFLPFENKETNLKVSKRDEYPAQKSSSSARNYSSTSQDTSNKNKDLVTLHKYKPKQVETTRYKRDYKNVSPVEVISSSQRNNGGSRNLSNVLKEKTPKTDVHELRGASMSESQKNNPNPEGEKIDKKGKAKNAVPSKNQENYCRSEATVFEKPNKAKEDSARDNSQKPADNKESQAALILIPVEAESLSKTEMILIEQLDKFKKKSKETKK